MIGYWDGSVIRLTDGTEQQADYIKITAIAMSLEENLTLYAIENRPLYNWLEYLMSNGVSLSDTGREKNSVSTLRSVDGKIYHVSYKNNGGKKLRICKLENLIRNKVMDELEFETKTDNPTDAIMESLKVCDNMGLDSMTIGSEAMKHYRQNLGLKKYYQKFPKIDRKVETEMRTAYIGGYLQAKPGDYGKSVDYDCNSLYPHILAEYFLPFGEPERFEGKYVKDKEKPLHIDRMTFRADLKKDGYPFLTIPHNRFDFDSQHIVSTRGYVTMCLSNVDIDLLYENYDVSVYENLGGWKFRQSKGFFTDYVDIWGNVKKKSIGLKRSMSKLMLVSIVGKMGSFARDTSLRPFIGEDGKLEWRIGKSSTGQSANYLPVAVFVNAWGRRVLLDVLRLNAGHVIYANTDGFVLDTDEKPKGIELDETELGKWKIQNNWKRLRILNVGLYQGERADGTGFDLVSSGISRNTPIPWDKFVQGGTILDDNGVRVML